jgi:signal transduction histidine kinase
MLHDFILTNREVIIERTRLRVLGASVVKPEGVELAHGVPFFLNQLVAALAPQTTVPSQAEITQGIDSSAALHGQDLLRTGFTVGQVVHGYGDVCQVVTELAFELKAEIGPDEFQVFNRCLDDAVAGAVTAYGLLRERDIADAGTERLGVLAHEARNLLNTAILSFDVIRRGKVGLGGSTGAILARSLSGLRSLVERSLAVVRLDAGLPILERILVRGFIEELALVATMQAEAQGLELVVSSVNEEAAFDGDRQLLSAAVLNLLQNAFKFTTHGTVKLTVRVTPARVLIDVSDQCGGLPPGKAEELFQPFTQKGTDRSGLGLGLSIALSAAQASNAKLYVKNVPGTGCVFTLDLPRQSPPLAAMGDGDGAQAVDGLHAAH